MAASAHPGPKALAGIFDNAPSLAAVERTKSLVLRAWILTGVFFMALPGTLLGFSNLMAISAHHGAGGLPAAWMEGHGHAQVFGWIGSFILGIGFYSQPALGRSMVRIPLSCFLLWSVGVGLRWTANIYGWHWRIIVPLSAGLELIAVLLFLSAASHHKLPAEGAERRTKRRIELWMVSVLAGTAGLAAAVVFNFVECVRLALAGVSPSFPHALDQKYLVLLGWGFLVPVVWGFSSRWLPAFLGIAAPHGRIFCAALLLDVLGVIGCVSGQTKIAVFSLAAGAVASGLALRLVEHSRGKAKTEGVHSSFPVFARIPYVWLAIAGVMSVWAAFFDEHGGIWGASRHALTVGFAATMVFTIGPRILPHFGGIYRIFSTRLMFAALLLLQMGCALRVSSEPLDYEGILPAAWNVLPISGMLELAGVLMFAANIVLTLFCLRVLQPGRIWKEGILKVSFWCINLGLVFMVILSMLPVGLLQAWASIERGTWYARSAEFLQSGPMQTLRWMRVPGDVLFAVGAALLGWFVLSLLTGHSYQKRSAALEGTSFEQIEEQKVAALAGD